MTAEQLEELAGGRDPSFMGMDCEEAIKALARRVIAAEKLVEALKKADEALHNDGCRPTMWPRPQIAQALTAYEATK